MQILRRKKRRLLLRRKLLRRHKYKSMLMKTIKKRRLCLYQMEEASELLFQSNLPLLRNPLPRGQREDANQLKLKCKRLKKL
jgi:hypothetical protein